LRSLLARNKEGFTKLLEHGADPNVLDAKGAAVMNYAASEEDPFWLAQALKHKGNPNLLNEGNTFFPGSTPLFYAISAKRPANAKLLIAGGADLNAKDGYGLFPLLSAAMRPAYDIVYTLLEAGADYQQKDAHGQTVLEWLSRRNEDSFPDFQKEQRPWFSKTVEWLRKKGVKVEIPPKS